MPKSPHHPPTNPTKKSKLKGWKDNMKQYTQVTLHTLLPTANTICVCVVVCVCVGGGGGLQWWVIYSPPEMDAIL